MRIHYLLVVSLAACGNAAPAPRTEARIAPPPSASSAPEAKPAPPPAAPKILPLVPVAHGCSLSSWVYAKLRPAKDKDPFVEVSARGEVVLGTEGSVVTTALYFGGAIALRGIEARAERPLYAKSAFRFGDMVEAHGKLLWRSTAENGGVQVAVDLPKGAALDGQNTIETTALCDQLSLERSMFAPLDFKGWANGDLSSTMGGPARLTGFSGAAKLVTTSGSFARVVVQDDDFVAYGWMPKAKYEPVPRLGIGHGYGTGRGGDLALAVSSAYVACPDPTPILIAYEGGYATAGLIASHAPFLPDKATAKGELTEIHPDPIDGLHFFVNTADLQGCSHDEIRPPKDWRR